MRQSPQRITVHLAAAAVLVVAAATLGHALAGTAALVTEPPASARTTSPPTLLALAERALSAEARESGAATAALRVAGQDGLDALFDVHEGVLRHGPADPAWERLTAVLDAVARQKDAFAARLYWYTDLEQAKAAARASGRPILSLRLLGDLGDDLSCANSRFFRTVLYANRKVAQVLRDRFVLHWQSERPAPRITIDFGDGRALASTITGNSIHYLLDTEGRPVDALPGLWGPQAFLAELKRGEELARTLAEARESERARLLRRAHQLRLRELGAERPGEALVEFRPGERVDAIAAGRRTDSKMMVERPMLREVVPGRGGARTAPTDEIITLLPVRTGEEARLDSGSVALMRLKLARRGEGMPVGTPDEQARFAAMLAAFEQSIARDQARNRLTLHRRIHEWFVRGELTTDLERLNRRVYDELFLTPRSDPWLGLLEPEAYRGLDAGGVRPTAELRR